MADEVMTDSEAEAFVVSLLRSFGPLTTMDIETLARKRHRRCPDQTVLFLAKLMHRGVILGEVSVGKGGWVWQTPPAHTRPG